MCGPGFHGWPDLRVCRRTINVECPPARAFFPQFTLKATVLLAVPLALVTLTFLDVVAANRLITKFAVIVVAFTTVTPLTVTLFPDTATVVPAVKLAPVNVTRIVELPVVLWVNEIGLMLASVATGGLATVKVTLPLGPAAFVTLTFRAAAVALPAITNVAVMLVSLLTVKPDTVTPFVKPPPPPPPPCRATFTAVAPVRPVPVNVTEIVVPRTPLTGLMFAKVGGPTSVNVTAPLVPLKFDAVTLLAPAVAFDATANLAVICVPAAFTATLLTVIPVPLTANVDPAKLLPVKVTFTFLVPVAGIVVDTGVIEVNVGGGAARTVKLTAPLVPPAVVTVTARSPSAAFAETVKVAVSVVEFVRATLLTVTPVPATATVLAAVNCVPVSVTATMVPSAPDGGLMAVSVGGAGMSSTAPMDTPDAGRVWP